MSKIGNYVVGLQEAAATKVDCPECKGEGECAYDRFVPMGFSNDYGDLLEAHPAWHLRISEQQ